MVACYAGETQKEGSLESVVTHIAQAEATLDDQSSQKMHRGLKCNARGTRDGKDHSGDTASTFASEHIVRGLDREVRGHVGMSREVSPHVRRQHSPGRVDDGVPDQSHKRGDPGDVAVVDGDTMYIGGKQAPASQSVEAGLHACVMKFRQACRKCVPHHRVAQGRLWIVEIVGDSQEQDSFFEGALAVVVHRKIDEQAERCQSRANGRGVQNLVEAEHTVVGNLPRSIGGKRGIWVIARR